MRRRVHHAIVREQGSTFAVVMVKDHIVTNSRSAASMIEELQPIYGCTVILMGESNRRTHGRQDIVRFLQRVHPSQLPWREGYIDVPSQPPAAGGGNVPNGPRPVGNICEWYGASGAVYRYHFTAISAVDAPNADGNYIFAYFNNDQWAPLYIGQGSLLHRVGSTHHQWSCIIAKGATHVHVRTNPDERARLDEEDDLLANFPGAYSPVGCNERTGG